MLRKKVSFEVEKKMFDVSFEGFNGGTWVSIAERSRGQISVVGFEREEMVWITGTVEEGCGIEGFHGFC